MDGDTVKCMSSEVAGISVMDEKDRQILREFASRVRATCPEARIWAFGSRAHGGAAPDSDLDVCVVVDDLNDARDREIIAAAWEVGFPGDVLISTITFSREEFTTGAVAHSSIVRAIRRDGVAA